MENRERRARSKQAKMAREHLPEAAVNLSAAALIWLFGVLVFLPTAERIDTAGLPAIVSLIILFSFSFFLIRGSKGLGVFLDAASDLLAYEWTRRRKKKRAKTLEEKTKRGVKATLYGVAIIIVYLLYSPLLVTLHPAINGIAIIVTIFGILWILLQK